ncbi:MAG: NAD-dependent epimerase/dehydratase family protein [Gammaproteobacteria bacterium]|nr:NAD-dependent epimerase/dehydratase family protein [Gammaproteobacteria bacterium]MBU1481669.1 NAD-dependent epimerase/dehydratase family protein [Gammaproteobacteria bacterium]
MNEMSGGTILVIGGTGLVGSALVPRLVASGRKVYCLSRSGENVPTGALPLIADLRDPEWLNALAEIPERVDSLIYLAYSISQDRDADWRVNSVEMQRAANYIKPSEIVFTGSVGVFGAYPDEGAYTEDSVRVADTDYARAKLDAIGYLKKLELKCTVLHPSIVWASSSPRVDYYRDQLRRGYYVYKGDGSGYYNIVHADDVASAIMLSLRRQTGGRFEEYIVNAERPPFREWIDIIEHRFGYDQLVRLPVVLAPLARGPFRKFLSIFGRTPMLITEPKSSSFERKVDFSSAKIVRELGWCPENFAKKILLSSK